MTFDFEIHPSKVLRHYTWQLFHIFRAYQCYMENMHFWSLALKICPWLWTFCAGHCLETINGNCFIFSRHINLPWDMCTDLTFWSLTLILWLLLWISCPAYCSETINLHMFRAYQSFMGLAHSHFNPFYCLCPWNYDLWLWNLVYKLFFRPGHGVLNVNIILLIINKLATFGCPLENWQNLGTPLIWRPWLVCLHLLEWECVYKILVIQLLYLKIRWPNGGSTWRFILVAFDWLFRLWTLNDLDLGHMT